jgi:hypothetical protein
VELGIGVKVAGMEVASACVGMTGMEVNVSATTVPSVSGVGAGVPVTPQARTARSKTGTGRNFSKVDFVMMTSFFSIVSELDAESRGIKFLDNSSRFNVNCNRN